MEKKYYEKIMGMTLNIGAKELYDIMDYVEGTHLHEIEFYNNLYALVEKEKYLKEKFNYAGTLFSELSESARYYLMHIFVKRVSEQTGEDENTILEQINKLGYESIIDPSYRKFFDNCEFINNQSFDMDEGKWDVYMDDRRKQNIAVRTSDRPDFHLLGRGKFPDVVFHKFRNVQRRIDTDCDYYFVQSKVCDLNNWYAVNKETGECIRIPNRIGYFPEYKLGYFVQLHRQKDNSPWIMDFYNEKFKKLMTFDNVYYYYVDNRLDLFLVKRMDGIISLYNKELQLVGTIDLNKLYGVTNVIGVNDGVLSLATRKDNKIIYYDYINMREIDSFKANVDIDLYTYLSHFVYSEGVYPHINSNGDYDYKNKDGDVVFDQTFDFARPFLGNVAQVYFNHVKNGKEYSERYVVDRTGNLTPNDDCYKEIYKNRKKYFSSLNTGVFFLMGDHEFLTENPSRLYLRQDFKKGRYLLDYNANLDFLRRVRGYLVAEDNYLINVYTPIKDIDFDKEKEKAL